MIGIKEAMRMKKDLNLEEMSDDCFLSVLKNYIKVEEEPKPTECVVYFHNTTIRMEFKLLSYSTENSWLLSLIDELEETNELRFTESELSLILKIINDGERFYNLRNLLQEVGHNRFNW